MLQIGEVADRVGLSLRTVRYYEEMGLLAPADRTEGGFRLYTEDQVDRLQLIKQMKPLGFTVQEMRALLHARDVLVSHDSSEEDRQAARESLAGFASAAAARIDALREQLARAEEFAKELRRRTRKPRASSAKR
jgi:DNA-binding transcriptional MerR regulator